MLLNFDFVFHFVVYFDRIVYRCVCVHHQHQLVVRMYNTESGRCIYGVKIRAKGNWSMFWSANYVCAILSINLPQ